MNQPNTDALELLNRHAEYIRRIAYRFGVRDCGAEMQEEYRQELVVRILSKYDTLDYSQARDPHKVEVTWIGWQARKVRTNMLRAQRREIADPSQRVGKLSRDDGTEYDPIEWVPVDPVDPVEEAEDYALVEAVRLKQLARCFAMASERERACMSIVSHGLSDAEARQRYGIRKSTATQVLRNLGRRVRRYNPDDDKQEALWTQ